jgi:4-amino-4-deoxy-L-arabinose transferase-like glycosyltransferase
VKRLRRIIFNGLTVLSLLLCVATSALWVRSYWVDETMARWSKHTTGYNFLIGSAGGIVHFERLAGSFEPNYPNDVPRSPLEYEYSRQPYRRGKIYDVGWQPDASVPFRHFWFEFGTQPFIAVPHWSVVALFTVLPLTCFHRHARRRGLCPHCGYDLRATPDRCPECGVEPKNSK